MKRILSFSLIALGAAGLVAAAPGALSGVATGNWEVSPSATGEKAVRRCVRDLSALVQWHARDEGRCTRLVLEDKPGHLRARFTCAGGDFGTSEIEVITPRSLRIATQGIKDGLPFSEVYHARRVGDCPR